MRVNVYWISDVEFGQLGVMARPRGGDWLEDEITSLKFMGVNVVASLLEATEADELDISAESSLCEAQNIKFMSFPIVDRSVPVSLPEFSRFVEKLSSLLRCGKSIVVHCRQGVGRATLLATSILVFGGITVEEAFAKVEQARGCPIPDTPEQKAFVVKFAETLT